MKNTDPDFQPLTYAGGLYDSDTKLIRFGARDYDPTIGRWTAKDPIGFAGGDTNLYAYVGGNPMSKTDPTGLWEWPWNIYDNASQETKNSGLPGNHNGQADAFRHCVASCMMTVENGSFTTWLLSEAHEKRGDWTHNQPPSEKCMDRDNNATGNYHGGNSQQVGNCAKACMGSLKSGALTIQPVSGSNGY